MILPPQEKMDDLRSNFGQKDGLPKETILICILLSLGSLFFCVIPKICKRMPYIKFVIRYSKPIMVGLLIPLIFFDSLLHMFIQDNEINEHQLMGGSLACVCAISILFLIDTFFSSKDDKHKPSHCESEITQMNLDRIQERSTSTTLLSGARSSSIPPIESHSSQNDDSSRIFYARDDCCNTDMIRDSNTTFSIFIFILVISIHAIFEGLGFKSSGEFGSYELGITIHKALESLTVGIAFNESIHKFRNVMIWSVIFSILTPIGILFGNLLKSLDFMVFGVSIFTICQGLSLGSLIYVVFVKMLAPMTKKGGTKLIDIILFIFSIISASSFLMLIPHGH
jgi:zinc transporter ZupT